MRSIFLSLYSAKHEMFPLKFVHMLFVSWHQKLLVGCMGEIHRVTETVSHDRNLKAISSSMIFLAIFKRSWFYFF